MLARHKFILKRENANLLIFLKLAQANGLDFTRKINHVYVYFIVNIRVVLRLTKN